MIRHQQPGLIVFESALYRTTSTIFYNEDLLLLVDPSWLPEEIKTIQKTLAELPRRQPFFLLFTHSDFDHILAWKAFDGMKTIASKAFTANPKKMDILREIHRFDQSLYLQREYPIEYPEIEIVVEKEGTSLSVGHTRLTFFLAPGHTADGIFTVIEPQGIWLAGDYLSNIEFPFVYDDSRKYEVTLQKIENLTETHPFQLLIPGHGDIAFTRAEVLSRKKAGEDYLRGLRQAVATGGDLGVEKWAQDYPFPGALHSEHEANVKLVKKELEME